MQQICAKRVWIFLVLGVLIAWNSALSPAAAQGPGAGPLLEELQPTSELPGPGEKQEAAPTTCDPLISDTCIPIEEHHASLQWLGALSFYLHNFSPNWRYISAGGNLYTFNMPVKFTYGPTKDLETYYGCSFLS